MILVHTDYGRVLMESMRLQDPTFDTLFFLRRDSLPISGAGEYYEQISVVKNGQSFYLDIRFSYGEDRLKVIESIEVFDKSYTKVLTAIEIRVPVTAGSLTYKDDTLYLSGASDRLGDNGGDDFLDLGGGNDIYEYRNGDDRVLGNTGRDLVMIAAGRDDVDIVRSGYEVSIDFGDRVLSLNSIERVQFADGMLAFDVGAWETAGGVYRLYQAAFDRTPDAGGLAAWISFIDAGVGDLKWAATYFISSPEFQQTYGATGTVSNEAFVNLLYENVLDRAAEDAGAQYWIASLGQGMERSHVLLNFSESAENQAKVAPAIHDGFWY